MHPLEITVRQGTMTKVVTLIPTADGLSREQPLPGHPCAGRVAQPAALRYVSTGHRRLSMSAMGGSPSNYPAPWPQAGRPTSRPATPGWTCGTSHRRRFRTPVVPANLTVFAHPTHRPRYPNGTGGCLPQPGVGARARTTCPGSSPKTLQRDFPGKGIAPEYSFPRC